MVCLPEIQVSLTWSGAGLVRVDLTSPVSHGPVFIGRCSANCLKGNRRLRSFYSSAPPLPTSDVSFREQFQKLKVKLKTTTPHKKSLPISVTSYREMRLKRTFLMYCSLWQHSCHGCNAEGRLLLLYYTLKSHLVTYSLGVCKPFSAKWGFRFAVLKESRKHSNPRTSFFFHIQKMFSP